MADKQFVWGKSHYGGYRAEMPNEVTLVVSPSRTKGFIGEPARGTTWRAQASQWDERTKCVSRYGRDEYGIERKTAKDAMRAAEAIYTDAQ